MPQKLSQIFAVSFMQCKRYLQKYAWCKKYRFFLHKHLHITDCKFFAQIFAGIYLVQNGANIFYDLASIGGKEHFEIMHFGELHSCHVTGNIFVSQLYFWGIILVTPYLWHHAIFSLTSCNRRQSYIVLTLSKTRDQTVMMLKTIADPLKLAGITWMGISHGQLKNDARSDWSPPKWPLWKQLHTALQFFVRTPTGRGNAQLETSNAVLPGSRLKELLNFYYLEGKDTHDSKLTSTFSWYPSECCQVGYLTLFVDIWSILWMITFSVIGGWVMELI